MNRFVFIFLCLGWLVAMAAMVALGHLSHHLIAFSLLYGLAFVLLFAIVSKFPPYLNRYNAFLLILILGFTGRALFLFYPVGNDVYRYVWEGYIQSRGFNPFSHAPLDPALTEIAQGDLHAIWQNINHKEFSAAYPALTLLVFRFLAWLNPDPIFFKIAMVLIDIGVMIVLALIINIKHLPARRLLLYACNPLVIVFVAGEGHMDVIQVFFLFLGVFLLLNRKEIAGFVSMGLAAVSKYFAGIAVPFFITADSRKTWTFVFLPLLLYIAYLDAGRNLISSLMSFGSGMHYNDSMFALFRFIFGDAAPLAAIFFLFICLAWIFLFVHEPLHGAYLALCCLLVLLPTLHPWYLVLIAPFMVFYPSKAWLYLQAAMVFTFPVMAVDYKTGVFQEIQWLKLSAYVPFFGLLARGIWRDGLLFREASYSQVKNISVIIPTLNESERISRCLASLQNRTAIKEIIVADGGSSDDTRQIAANWGARVVGSQKGRGYQIKAGAEAASGDVLLILHADCLAKKGLFSRAIKALGSNPHAVGGAFSMEFEKKAGKTSLIALLNNARTLLTGISFGDQAQFLRAEVLRQINGLPAVMLMEDVELSLRLKQVGRVLFLKDGVLASGRRWGKKTFTKNFFTVLRLFARYLIERRFCKGERPDQTYYRRYYNSK